VNDDLAQPGPDVDTIDGQRVLPRLLCHTGCPRYAGCPRYHLKQLCQLPQPQGGPINRPGESAAWGRHRRAPTLAGTDDARTRVTSSHGSSLVRRDVRFVDEAATGWPVPTDVARSRHMPTFSTVEMAAEASRQLLSAIRRARYIGQPPGAKRNDLRDRARRIVARRSQCGWRRELAIPWRPTS